MFVPFLVFSLNAFVLKFGHVGFALENAFSYLSMKRLQMNPIDVY